MKNVIQRVIAGGALVHDDKILIVQRAMDEDYFPGYWEVPSGKKEPQETVKNAAKREFKEETGIDIEVTKPIDVFNYEWEDGESIRDATQIVFLVKALGSTEVRLSTEHQAFAWISLKEIDNYKISEETKKMIKLAFKS